ncbi:hypothetical protein C8J57DRAFT_1246143 [Mycena rebaudengoi]|nr:hypothetical protein C8J57DRAFT_1246143 [Mycena rebaudengoi]
MFRLNTRLNGNLRLDANCLNNRAMVTGLLAVMLSVSRATLIGVLNCYLVGPSRGFICLKQIEFKLRQDGTRPAEAVDPPGTHNTQRKRPRSHDNNGVSIGEQRGKIRKLQPPSSTVLVSPGSRLVIRLLELPHLSLQTEPPFPVAYQSWLDRKCVNGKSMSRMLLLLGVKAVPCRPTPVPPVGRAGVSEFAHHRVVHISLLRQEHQVPLAEAPSTEPFRLSFLPYVFSSERHKYSASSYSCIRSYLKLLAHTRNQHPTSLTPEIINRHLAIFLCLSPLATLLDEDFTAPAFGVITTYMCQALCGPARIEIGEGYLRAAVWELVDNPSLGVYSALAQTQGAPSYIPPPHSETFFEGAVDA